MNEDNWPTLFPIHHGQLVIATAPSDCHQVRGHLMLMRGRHLESGTFVPQSFEILENSTKRMVICDADEYNIQAQLPSKSADVAASAGAVTPTLAQLHSHVASGDDNGEVQAASQRSSHLAFNATATSPSANSSATADVAASAGAVTPTSAQLHSHAASVHDNGEGQAASQRSSHSAFNATATSPSANSSATAAVDASVGAVTPASPRPSHQHSSAVLIDSSDSDEDTDEACRQSSDII
jgi:hypothetical protein